MARTVRSGRSRKPCYLRFINCTTRKVDIIWIDYTGSTKNYGTLDCNRHFDIHTYVDHPWICEDSETKNRLLLNKFEIFYPSSPDDQIRTSREVRYAASSSHELSNDELLQNDSYYLQRELVNITLPVFSLSELSAEVIIKNIRAPEDVKFLELPSPLKNLLLDLHPLSMKSHSISLNKEFEE